MKLPSAHPALEKVLMRLSRRAHPSSLEDALMIGEERRKLARVVYSRSSFDSTQLEVSAELEKKRAELLVLYCGISENFIAFQAKNRKIS